MTPTRPIPERIGSLIPHVLKHVEEQHRPLVTIQRGWAGWVGKRLAAHTRPVSLQHGRLIVYANRPGDSFALSYQRTQLLEQIQAATEGRVEEIVIRPGDWAGTPHRMRKVAGVMRHAKTRALQKTPLRGTHSTLRKQHG